MDAVVQPDVQVNTTQLFAYFTPPTSVGWVRELGGGGGSRTHGLRQSYLQRQKKKRENEKKKHNSNYNYIIYMYPQRDY